MNKDTIAGLPVTPQFFETKTTGPSLRDQFAMAALPSLITQQEIDVMKGDNAVAKVTACWDEPDYWSEVAIGAYAIADAMLLARNPKTETPHEQTPNTRSADLR